MASASLQLERFLASAAEIAGQQGLLRGSPSTVAALAEHALKHTQARAWS